MAQLRTSGGEILALSGNRWLGRADETDELALALATGPVLDLGCGPGRHVQALAERGVVVLGIDLSRHAVDLARSKGLAVLERSVFDEIPKAGEWASALLLDGNIGIGGDPLRLLQHVRSLLCSNGRLVVEVNNCIDDESVKEVRLELNGEPGPWFAWAQIDLEGLHATALQAEMRVAHTWIAKGRCFAVLDAGLADCLR